MTFAAAIVSACTATAVGGRVEGNLVCGYRDQVVRRQIDLDAASVATIQREDADARNRPAASEEAGALRACRLTVDRGEHDIGETILGVIGQMSARMLRAIPTFSPRSGGVAQTLNRFAIASC